MASPFPAIYQWYQILLMLIKFDLFFALTFSIQYLVLQLAPSDPEFAVTIVALPVAIVFSIAAIWGAKHENRPVMTAFVVLLLITIAYFVFKIVRMYQPSQRYKYTYTYKYLTFFGGLRGADGGSSSARTNGNAPQSSRHLYRCRRRSAHCCDLCYPQLWRGARKASWVAWSSRAVVQTNTSMHPPHQVNDTESTLTRPRPSKLEEAETKPNTSLYSTTKALMSAQGVSLPDAAALKIPTNAVAAPQLSADGGGVDYNEVVNSGRI